MTKTYKCPESLKFHRLRNFNPIPDDKGIFHFTEETCHELIRNVCGASCNYPFLFERHYDVLSFVGSQFGLSNPFKTQGILASSDRTIGIFHFALSDKELQPALSKIRNRSVPVTHTYKGEKLFLARSKNLIGAYDLEKLNTIEHLMWTLDDFFPSSFGDFNIDPETSILSINSHWVWIALAPLSGKGQEEEERIRLSERIEESQPFFEFKAPIQIVWDLLKEPKDENFEEICRQLLLKEPGIKDVVTIGKTRAPDRGRDFEAYQIIEGLGNFTKSIKWLVQCKFSTKSISPKIIAGWTDRVREHGCDGFWLMTNNDVTPSLVDQFRGVQQNDDIKVKFWQRGDFHTKLNIYAEVLKGENFFDN